MQTAPLTALALVALALAATPFATAADDPCTGVEGVQELCAYPGPSGQTCYHWKGVVLNGHPFC